MKYLIYLLAIIFLLALNLGLFPLFSVNGTAPNFLFLLVLFAALEKHNYDFYFIAFAAGIFLDLYSGLFLGSFILGFALLAGLLNGLAKNFLVADLNWKYAALVIFVAMVFLDIFFWTYNGIMFNLGWAPGTMDLKKLALQFPWQLGYNLLFAFPACLFLDKIKDFINRLIASRQHRSFV